MKKIYYLLIVGVLGFAACQKEPALQTSTHSVTGLEENLTITLKTSDYAKISSGYPKTSYSFDNITDANTYIPQILNSEYVTPLNGSTAAVTYTTSALYWKPNTDSVYADQYYALTSADYLLLPGNTYADFSLAQMLQWLPYKYTGALAPTANELRLIKFTPYPTSLTPAPPYSYLYFNGAWKQIYTVTPAQYTSVNVGQYDEFTTSWTESALVGAFNTFMKNDPTLMDTVKKNDLIFVSFNYYVSSTKDYQRVKPLQFDGNNFVVPFTTTNVATFVKANGVWKPQPIINYTLTTADITIIENGAAGSAAAKSNLTSYGDFSSAWATSDMDAAVIECLLVDIKTPVTGTVYKVTFPNYSSPAPDPLSFTWSGTAWVAQQ